MSWAALFQPTHGGRSLAGSGLYWAGLARVEIKVITLRRKSLHNPFGISRAVRSALSSLWVGRRPIGTHNPGLGRSWCNDSITMSAPRPE